jgi:hypothetical protein
MITFIIKSSLSLIVMFGLYWFLLRKEKLFAFNRVFLIFSVLFSLTLPFISIPISIQNSEPQGSLEKTLSSVIPAYSLEQYAFSSTVNQSFNKSEPLQVPLNGKINYSQILVLLYITGVLLLLVRFIRNIFFISHQMKISEKITYSGQRLVLTNNQINPFCFFNTIFVSKQDYLNNEIAEELLSHEIEHIRQSHSADVIFIELVKIIYWFNPILVLYSKAIRVNHEYLADNAVIQGSSDIKNYAEKLLNYISSRRNIPLTSGFNPSLTRKRLLMITKSRSGIINHGARIFITLNLVIALLFILSFKPSYSQPILPDKNINVISDLKPEKGMDIEKSPNKIGKDESAVMINTKHISEKIVKGFVVNKYGKYIEGLQIFVSGKKSGVTTDKMGHFEINNVPEDAILTFSYDGYITQKIKPVFNSEMVVRFIIENESALTKEKITSTYLPDFETNPVIIIDSVPVGRESMYNIDPSNKVSSLKVLNGKEATDIYGESGKNGVIEILTERNRWGTSEKNRSATQNAEKLIIVNGVVYTKNPDNIPMDSIEILRVLGKSQATIKYGDKGKNGVIEIVTKGNTSVSANKTPETTKSETQVNVDGVVSVTNMNILYLGISNPVEIAVPGFTSDKVTASVTNGTINRSATGWDVKPASLSDLVLTVLVDNNKVTERNFRVKPIPPPVAVFAGINNGSASKDALVNATLEAELKDFLWDLKFEIVSFTFLFKRDGLNKEIASKGNVLTPEMKSIISDLTRGQYINFKDIKAIGPDGRSRELSPVILKID